MFTSVLGDRPAARRDTAEPENVRPIPVAGAIGACAAAAVGLVILTLLVLIGWIAAPHGGTGLTGVLRAAAALWLIGHHVGFALHGAGRIGMLPLGLVLLPGALLWRAGRWTVRSAGVTRLRHAGYAALALAAPYGVLAAGLALASRSAHLAPSVLQAAAAGFALALTAGGLGGLRALAPWSQLTGLLPVRLRSVIAGAIGSLAVLAAVGAILTGVCLGAHLHAVSAATAALDPGTVGTGLLLLAQLGYLPNAVIWAISFTVGPGFAFGTGTTVAPTGSALGSLPQFPMLAALPSGLHSGLPLVLLALVLAVPYLAGAVGGALLARAAPSPVLEMAPLWGFLSGALAGCILGILAAFAGGPLGDGRLAEVGPSGWQVGLVAALELGIAAAVSAGAANWLRFRGQPRPAAQPGRRADTGWPPDLDPPGADDDGHLIYLDPWADDGAADDASPPPTGPAGPLPRP
ncbi:MAG: DUF6350 family protein [Streptosporangiaceae bacterium]